MSDEFGVPIYEFQKSKRARICFHLQEFKGSTFLSIREFYLDKASGEWRPTQKGVTVPPRLYQQLLEGVVMAADVLGGASAEDFDEDD